MSNKAADKAAEEHPGAALKAARERQGASIAAVATSAHLDESLVGALEEGRYDAFHAPAYIYGYIRAYARFVGVDADPLVEQLDYRPVPLPAVQALARELIAGRYPEGETTLERIANVTGDQEASQKRRAPC